MKKIKEFLNTLSETTTVTKKEYLLVVTVATLLGMVIGMLCSPRKNMKIGSDNGNNYDSNNCEGDNYDDSWEYDLDDWGDEDELSF